MSLKSLFQGKPLWQKIIFGILLPLMLLVVFSSEISSFIGGILENRRRSRVDEELGELDSEEDKVNEERHKSDGRLDQIEKDRKKAKEDAKKDDSADWHNSRDDD